MTIRTDGPPDSETTALGRRTTGTEATRVLGIVTLAGLAWLILFGLFLSPADKNQGESVRFLFLHAPSAWIAYVAFVVTAGASALYLFRKQHSLAWDRLAGPSGRP